MTLSNVHLSDEDRAGIKEILLQWRTDGVANPLLPLDVDLNNDGLADAFGLDENDEVVPVYGTPLSDTVYKSDGDDVVPPVTS